jgi:hypothetical protein
MDIWIDGTCGVVLVILNALGILVLATECHFSHALHLRLEATLQTTMVMSGIIEGDVKKTAVLEADQKDIL